MAEGKLVLITGASGLIGGLVASALSAHYRVRALNRRATPDFDTVQADLTDFDAICPAFEGVDTVVHLAAALPENSGTDQLIAVNVQGTYNVFEAARQAGVRRVVFGSSGSTVAGYERDEPYRAMTEARWADVPTPRPLLDHHVPARPNGVYGATKVWGEALGRCYSDQCGMSVICIRIGRVVEEDWPRDARHASVYLSHRDIVQMIERCVDAPDSVRFDIFYAVSDNRGRFRDIEHARQRLGFVPRDGIADWPIPRP